MRKRTSKKGQAEWVTLMALIAEQDRDAYRGLRKEAWDNARLRDCSPNSN